MKRAGTFSLIVIALALLPQASPKLTTIRFQVVMGDELVTFDPSRVSPSNLKRWMRLSPRGDARVSGSDNQTLVPEWPESFSGRGRGRHWCGQGAAPDPSPFVGSDLIRRRIRWLNPHNYPRGLAPVVLYLRNVQLYGLWLYRQVLAYTQNCDFRALEGTYKGVDLGASCAGAVDRIRSPGSGVNAVPLAQDAWLGCAWGAWHRKYGQYPKDAWHCFLASRGVRERFVYLGY